MNNLSSFWRKWFPKPLLEEVIAVFDSAPGIKKLGHNDEDDYDFLKILTLCDEFKGDLFQRGILFIATDRDTTFEQISEGDGRYLERCTVTTDFAVIRGKERLELGSALGSARDHSDKALAIAQTAAFKAFLKRSSMTYGQEDDPETKRDSLGPKESVRVASYQRRALDAALRDTGISPTALSERLSENLGFPIDCAQIADLPRVEFDQAMKLILAMGREDLTNAWSAAVVDIQSKKAQPVVAQLDHQPSDEIAGD